MRPDVIVAQGFYDFQVGTSNVKRVVGTTNVIRDVVLLTKRHRISAVPLKFQAIVQETLLSVRNVRPLRLMLVFGIKFSELVVESLQDPINAYNSLTSAARPCVWHITWGLA